MERKQIHSRQNENARCEVTQDPAKRPLEIPDALRHAEFMIDTLSEEIAQLGTRLTPVRSNKPEGGESYEYGPYSSPIGGDLARLIAKLALVRGAVAEIHSTLEL